MPCREWFDAQDAGYRDSVLPPQVRARVSVEAGVAQGWREVVGDAGRSVSLEHYGASAQYTELFDKFGFTAAAVVQRRARTASGPPPPGSHPRPGTTTSHMEEDMTDRLKELAAAGVSIWLDDLSRELLESGDLADLVARRSVVGVTTNPTIFASAPQGRRALRRPGGRAHRGGASVEDVIAELTTDDVRNALRRLRGHLRGDRRHRRPGLHRGATRSRVRHRGDAGGGPQPVAQGGPAQPAGEDPGHHRGAARRSPRRSARASAST